MKKIDARTLALLEQIRQQKKEISELSNPRWRTKCVFVDGKTEYNLHVLGVNDLIYVHSLLAEKERAYIASAKALGGKIAFLGYFFTLFLILYYFH